MIWVPDTQNEDSWHYMEGPRIAGTIHKMPNGKWMATTNKRYLGQYSNYENAQKAVEAKRAAETKGQVT
jgi:hypothetical protein